MRTFYLPLFIFSVFTAIISCNKKDALNDVSTDKIKTPAKVLTSCYYYWIDVTLGIKIPIGDNYIPAIKGPLPGSLMLDVPPPGDQGTQASSSAWAVVYGLGSYYRHLTSGKNYSITSSLSPKYTYNQIAKGNAIQSPILDNLYLLKEQVHAH